MINASHSFFPVYFYSVDFTNRADYSYFPFLSSHVCIYVVIRIDRIESASIVPVIKVSLADEMCEGTKYGAREIDRVNIE